MSLILYCKVLFHSVISDWDVCIFLYLGLAEWLQVILFPVDMNSLYCSKQHLLVTWFAGEFYRWQETWVETKCQLPKLGTTFFPTGQACQVQRVEFLQSIYLSSLQTGVCLILPYQGECFKLFFNYSGTSFNLSNTKPVFLYRTQSFTSQVSVSAIRYK